MSGLRLIASAALVLTTLAACAANPPVRVMGGRPAPHPEASADPESREDAEVAALPLPTAAEIARAPDPLTLKGGDAEAVVAALGEAPFLRREPPAQVWQYRGRTCVLDLVLYPAEDDAEALTVAHVEMRPVRDKAVPPKACAADVLQQRSVPSA